MLSSGANIGEGFDEMTGNSLGAGETFNETTRELSREAG